MRHTKSQIIFCVLSLIGFVFFMTGVIVRENSYRFIIAGVIVIAINYLQAFTCSRCPHCFALLMRVGMFRKNNLGVTVDNPVFCPNCGRKIDE